MEQAGVIFYFLRLMPCYKNTSPLKHLILLQSTDRYY